jgi:hypothetical protein
LRFVVDYTYQLRYNRGGFKEVTVVTKADYNEQFDDDILQSKADILRAKDIMPPYSDRPPQKDATANPPEKMEIPKFDLAEEIMAEHRKATAVKRKSPGQKTEPQIQKPAGETVRHTILPGQISSKQMQIISEIVARDIEKLCKSISQRGRAATKSETRISKS